MKRRTKSYHYIWCAAVVLILVTCTGPVSHPIQEISPGDGTASSIVAESTNSSPIIPPSDERVSVSPLLAPTVTAPIPTTLPGLATVLGTLIVMNPRYGAPKNGDSVYLVPIGEQPKDGLHIIPEVDPENSHKAIVNKVTGEFAFVNIPPGRYQMLVVTSVGTLPVRSMDTGRIEFLTIEADQVLDLGRVQIP